ncbi:MAG: 3-oxoacyl-[Lachnospiraceae bacterium]|nr:3-oxoacyl-[acyl-carrier-protein] reductase [Lachnospiraceae bacterium]
MSKNVIVTGGSRGIGRAICIKLAKEGYNVIFNYSKNNTEAEKTIKECEKYNVVVKGYKADIINSDECQELVRKAIDEFGSIDVLVNNAGITRDSLIMRMKDEDFNDVLRVNLSGTFYMIKAVSKYMIKNRSGSIINMSSIVGLTGNAGQINYSASKAGIVGLTKSAAKELASKKIRVNAIAPGMIDTDMTRVLSEDIRNKIIDSIPLKEIGKPEDIANAVAFLASDMSRYITGQILSVDGGMS